MDFEQQLKMLKNPKTNKHLHVRYAVNAWICQVVVENKVWSTVYHSNPIVGVPDFVAETLEQAREMVFEKAYHSALLYLSQKEDK